MTNKLDQTCKCGREVYISEHQGSNKILKTKKILGTPLGNAAFHVFWFI